ncbi:MAG: hypothetical protein HY796_03215 [Elusimicrobia bacterium]|nr:hypothetical protein [Elusimicrobiota bacterium]
MKKIFNDAQYLVNTLETTHPDLFFRCSRRQYAAGREKFLAKASVAESFADFSCMAGEFLHCIHDGHTSLQLTPDFSGKRLPVDTVLVENRLFIKKALVPLPGICDKAEILSIDGLPAFRYLKQTISLMSYELKERALQNAAAFFPYAWAHLNSHLPSVLVARAQDRRPVQLRLVWKKHGFPQPYGREPAFGLKYLENIRSGYLDWRQFIDLRSYDFCCKHGFMRENKSERSRFADWEAFLRGMFDELSDRGAKSLIIDLRHNTGGNSALGGNLIAYLTEKTIKKFSGYTRLSPLLVKSYGEIYGKLLRKFPMGSKVTWEQEEAVLGADTIAEKFALKKPPAGKFRGQVVLLTGPATYSAAEIFAALIKDNSLGILMGEATGNGGNGPIDSLNFTLPASKLIVRVSFSFRLRPAVGERSSKKLEPHIYKKQTVNDFLLGKDTVLEYAVESCKKMI